MIEGEEIKYACCICKETVAKDANSPLDPCCIWLISNANQIRTKQKEQQFFCHFECFDKIVNDQGIMYIADSDFPTIGEIEEECSGD